MDKDYWNDFYKLHGSDSEITNHSSFVKFCVEHFFREKNMNIVELGSGNGRDAIYLAHHNHNVIAIDQSVSAIDIEKRSIDKNYVNYFHPRSLDFVHEDYSSYKKIDAFYSRFTMHSISQRDEDILFPKVYNALEINGLFCIEARTTRDPLYGKGEFVSENTFIADGHKRRFIDTDKFREQVSILGFSELYFLEKDNLSIYKDDNPVLMRIILKK